LQTLENRSPERRGTRTWHPGCSEHSCRSLSHEPAVGVRPSAPGVDGPWCREIGGDAPRPASVGGHPAKKITEIAAPTARYENHIIRHQLSPLWRLDRRRIGRWRWQVGYDSRDRTTQPVSSMFQDTTGCSVRCAHAKPVGSYRIVMTRSPALAGTTVMRQLPEIVPASDCSALHGGFRICRGGSKRNTLNGIAESVSRNCGRRPACSSVNCSRIDPDQFGAFASRETCVRSRQRRRARLFGRSG